MDDLSAMLKRIKGFGDSVELYRYAYHGIDVDSQRGEMKASDLSSVGYYVRIIKDGRMAAVPFYRPAEAERSAKLAVSLSKYAEKLDMELPSKTRMRKAKTYDRKVAGLDADDLGDMMDAMNSSIDKRTEALEAGVYTKHSSNSIVNTEGVDLSEDRTMFSASMQAKVRGKDGVGERYDTTRFLFDSSSFGKEASEEALSQVGAKRIEPGKYRVVFDRRLGSFYGMFLQLFAGSAVAVSQSCLYDKLGETLFGGSLSITDAPFEQSSSSRSFDSEGTVSQNKAIIESGAVKNFMFSQEWLAKARKRRIKGVSTQTAGAADGGSNLKVKEGTIRDITDEGNVILVKSFMGSHSFSIATGDFGIVAHVGFRMRDGEVVHPINGVTINANMLTLMKSPILERKSFVQSGVISPRIGFDGVTCV